MAPLCIYCQKREGTTDDHVPPQSLFGSPLPPNLIKVPACVPCQVDTTEDDEYFKVTLVAMKAMAGVENVEQLRAGVRRGLHKPKAAKFKAALKRAERVVIADDGTATPQRFVDYDRLGRVVTRTVRGLHYRVFGKPLPPNYPVLCQAGLAFDASCEATTSKVAGMLTELSRLSETIVVPGVFSYRHTAFSADIQQSWLLTFFDRAWFLVHEGFDERGQRPPA